MQPWYTIMVFAAVAVASTVHELGSETFDSFLAKHELSLVACENIL